MSLRFAINSNVDCWQCDMGGWMHVLDIEGRRNVNMCNAPYEGVVGPRLRYSKLTGHTVLLTGPTGKITVD